MLTYHFISPSNPVNPENFLILGAKIRRKNVISKFFAENFSFLLRILLYELCSNMDIARLAWWRVQTGLFYDIGFDGHRSLLRWLMK